MSRENPSNRDIMQAFQAHVKEDEANFKIGNENFARLERVIFGDEDEMGMKKKVDAIYDMVVQARGIGNFFGGVKGTLGLLIALGASWIVIKGWFE